MNELLENLSNDTIATLVGALVVIMAVGCFKFIPALKNLKNSQAKKTIYHAISLVASALLAVLYCLFIKKAGWGMHMLTCAGTILVEVRVIYPIYENWGIRALFRKILGLVIPSKAKKVDKVLDLVLNTNTSDTSSEVLTSQQVKENQEKLEKTGWLQ